MPLFMVEREYAEALGLADLGAAALQRDREEESLHWLYSFLSADQRTSFCLFEAPSAEYLHALAARAGLPEAVVVEVDRVDRESLGVAGRA